MPEVDTGVYLTVYSTLASTLAGAFGFLVAVVLYVMQAVNTHVGNCAETLVEWSPADRNQLKRLKSSNRWDAMIHLHADAGQHNPQLSSDDNLMMDEQFQEMRRAVLQLVNMRAELNHAMYMTGIVILASIVAMPLTAFFMTPQSPIAVTILTATIIGAMFCIRGYFRLTQAALS
jgi:hypothetical protein